MVRNWRDRFLRFSMGALFGASIVVGVRYLNDIDNSDVFWEVAVIALILGLLTADIEKKPRA